MSSSLTRNPKLDLASPAVHRHPEEAWQRNLGRRTLAFPRDDSWWTGPNPKDAACPGRTADGWINALRMPDLARCKVSEAMDYFANGWVLTKLMFAALTEEEAFYRSPCHYFYLTACRFDNKLQIRVCVLGFRTKEATVKDLMDHIRQSLTRI